MDPGRLVTTVFPVYILFSVLLVDAAIESQLHLAIWVKTTFIE